MRKNCCPPAPVGTYHASHFVIFLLSRLSVWDFSKSPQIWSPMPVGSIEWRKCPCSENTWSVCCAQPVCNILKCSSTLQKVAEQESGEGETGPQAQPLVTRFRRNLHRPCCLVCWEHQLRCEVGILPRCAVHSIFPGWEPWGRASESTLVKLRAEIQLRNHGAWI